MSENGRRVFWRFMLFALLGLLMELFFTAFGDLFRGDWHHFRGSTSPWMMVDYGLLGIVVLPIARPLIRRRVPLALRAVVYMVGIFFIEFVSGWLFDIIGLRVWDYSNRPLNLYGYITLTYTPFWYALGLFVELLHRKIDAMALLLTRGITAEQLEAMPVSEKG